MRANLKTGYAVSAAFIALMAVAGVLIPEMEPGRIRLSKVDLDAPIMPTKEEFYVRDQLGARRIIQKARELVDEHDVIMDRYNAIPPFHPPEHGWLTEDQIETYISAYQHFVRQRNHFREKVVGKSPGFFRVFALVSIIHTKLKMMMINSWLEHDITEEEFFWTRDRLLEAALYCLQYEMDNHKHPEQVEQMMMDVRRNIYEELKIIEREQVGEDQWEQVFHPERIHLDKVPQNNIRLFLKYKKDVDWQHIHFDKPYVIQFHEQEILRSAANNPP